MKKELKQYIKSNKLSDDDILKLISTKPSASTESDIKDEVDEDSETQSESEETVEAESGIATESDTKTDESITKDSIEKMIADGIKKALEGSVAKKEPEVKKKTAPRPVLAPSQSVKANQFGIRDH